MLQVTPETPFFLAAGTDGVLVVQAAIGGAAIGVVLVVLVFAWRLRPACRRPSAVRPSVAPREIAA